MKKLISYIPFSFLLLLVPAIAGAQSTTAPEAKALNPEAVLKQTEKKSTVPAIKEPAKPVGLPIQQSALPAQEIPSAPVSPAIVQPAATSMRLNPFLRAEPVMQERPKTSTIVPPKSADPIQLPLKTLPGH